MESRYDARICPGVLSVDDVDVLLDVMYRPNNDDRDFVGGDDLAGRLQTGTQLLEKQLTDFLRSADFLPSLQSGFRPRRSTETVALRVLSDILEAVDSGDVAALVLLDLSAAFDTVDHAIVSTSAGVLWTGWPCAGVVSVLPVWAVAVRTFGMAYSSLPKHG